MAGMPRPPEYEKLIINGRRIDGRKPDELRPLKMEVGVIKRADGSAYVEMGDTKVLAGVYGPKEFHPKHLVEEDRCIIEVNYAMLPFSVEERVRPGPGRREREISKVLRHALESIAILEQFPQLGIAIKIDVIHADASTRVAALNAASLAMAHAGVPMRGLVGAVSVGKVDGVLVVDLCGPEDNYGEGDLPIGIRSNDGRIVLLQFDGNLTGEELKKALEMGEKACQTIIEEQKKALRRFYECQD